MERGEYQREKTAAYKNAGKTRQIPESKDGCLGKLVGSNIKSLELMDSWCGGHDVRFPRKKEGV